jgi:hypothetical protein
MNKNSKEETNICSLNHEFTEGSCFTIRELHEIAKNYNDSHKDQIKLYPSKKDMIVELDNKLRQSCSDQTCWATLKFIKNNDELNMAFKAKGPAGQFDWLSTTEINDCMERYMRMYPHFLFVGAVPIDIEDLDQFGVKTLNYDTLIKKGYYIIGIIFNLDEHYKSGSHWVAFFVDFKTKRIYYSDSAGKPPEQRVKRLVKKLAEKFYERDNPGKKIMQLPVDSYMNESGENAMEKIYDIKFNKLQHQYGGSECGVYSMNFIIRLLRGDLFDEIHKSRITDKDMNGCRPKYLRGLDNIITSKKDTFC